MCHVISTDLGEPHEALELARRRGDGLGARVARAELAHPQVALDERVRRRVGQLGVHRRARVRDVLAKQQAGRCR